MFPESKVTEIYCMADDFCKEFTLQQEKYMIKDMKTMHRNKPNRMSDAEIMVILILFHSGGFRCFKHYYKEYVCKHLKHLFPRQVSPVGPAPIIRTVSSSVISEIRAAQNPVARISPTNKACSSVTVSGIRLSP